MKNPVFLLQPVFFLAENQFALVQESNVVADLFQVADNVGGDQNGVVFVPCKFVKNVHDLVPDNRENLCLSKEEIGVVLDEVGISACLTTRQVGKIMQAIYRSWDEAVFSDYLTRLAVPADKKFKDFSRGMKMKLGIAVALSHHPRLLILDEATSGLDPVVRDEVMDIFNEFTRDENHAILISSHIVSDLEKICDYIAFLHKGKLILCEEKDRLKEEYGVLHCTAQDAAAIPASAIVGKRVSPLGCELLVKRSGVPGNPTFSPVDIEQLFIFMAKEEH